MAGLNVAPADQWSLCEKLCLASSVIRSGDQNWVSVSRAIKPFGEPGRPPDFFSQKNCALQYSALLETVETPKRKRSERGEVVETPGDLIVRKVTKERIAELKVQLEEDKARYRQLKLEIEEIRSGGADDRLQSMWEEVQEEKRAAKEAEETQKAAAEAAKAAAVVKPTSKPNFQSPSKRRPQVRNPRVGTRTQSETSSVGDSVEVEDSVLASPVKLTEESGSGPEDIATKQSENSATDFLTSIVANELQKETETATNQEEEVAAEEDSEETAERLLAATASDLVELLSPYPVDSPSSQSVDESSLPASEHGTPVPRVKEPLILKIEKGMVKTRESKVETKVPETEESHETEMINVDEPVSDRQPTSLQADKSADVTPVTKPRAEPGEDDYHHIEPPSPGDSSSREDSDMKSKRRGARGRPLGSQRKSSRIRTHTTTEEEDDRALDTPSGRRSSGKDGTASSIVSLMDEDSKDTHSEAGDSDVTDKPSESDDLSASTGALQSSYFLDSLPNSPASVAQSEEDHAYKTWRKAIMLVWRAVASHKYANVFLHPVTEDIAPGYKSIVMRPMDLITIKKNIENGMIRTTEQFHRDMMLMFQNAIMYNNADQHVHQIATVMQADVVKQIEEFVSTQLLVQQPDSTKMLRGRGKQGQGEEERSRRSSTEADTSGKKRRTRADEN
ncbi:bromodomain-containing protein 8-like isoform X6 [Acanthaster planci]|uniref:Bromodomain-containing protein 8-like isoform X6 n=1 Tax=Acanthaster planci TaxID=133434 RepID=A0A8B7ZTB7_ACAPL|nr:bromodomain-containing protein 8-like isoform X6 [Acanthaster planci]